MTHFSTLTSILMSNANDANFKYFLDIGKIPAPHIVYFKICIITIRYIDKLTCTFTVYTSDLINRFFFLSF